MADFVMPDMTEITLCCDSSQEAQRSARPQPAWFEADAQRLLALLAARNATLNAHHSRPSSETLAARTRARSKLQVGGGRTLRG